MTDVHLKEVLIMQKFLLVSCTAGVSASTWNASKPKRSPNFNFIIIETWHEWIL